MVYNIGYMTNRLYYRSCQLAMSCITSIQPRLYSKCDQSQQKLIACWVILHALLSSADYFSTLLFSKHSFRNTITVSNSLDPDQARRFVGPDLAPNCFAKDIDRRHKVS